MRVHVDIDRIEDGSPTPRGVFFGARRVAVSEVLDQWYGPGYRYVKIRGGDGGLYILRCDECHERWELILFASEAPRAPS